MERIKDKENVVIELMEDDLFHLYNESNQVLECSFEDFNAAEQWAFYNGYNIVECFYV